VNDTPALSSSTQSFPLEFQNLACKAPEHNVKTGLSKLMKKTKKKWIKLNHMEAFYKTYMFQKVMENGKGSQLTNLNIIIKLFMTEI
jgi:hypothetical protein